MHIWNPPKRKCKRTLETLKHKYKPHSLTVTENKLSPFCVVCVNVVVAFRSLRRLKVLLEDVDSGNGAAGVQLGANRPGAGGGFNPLESETAFRATSEKMKSFNLVCKLALCEEEVPNKQCDQMDKLFPQYLVIRKIENYPMAWNIGHGRFLMFSSTKLTPKMLP